MDAPDRNMRPVWVGGFDQQLDWSSQERIFTIMIGNLISRLDDPSGEAFLDMLIRLGKRHHDLGVRPQQYVSMQRSILVSLEELLGAEWNRDYRDAWASVFSFISHVMIKAAAEEAQRVAREGKQGGGKGRGEGGEGGGEASHGEGIGKGCPITAPAHMPVNKVLSGLQLESIHTSHPDGHYLHRTPAKKG
ncbi:hypothetical protein NSK_001990 [Nannochloropsis salina CCMP1776]|uniref:Globin domain-containing protein n=1 Tax=Nannochloropsis salina CCMP1776 TaxID=1027361 RepID=A0A4D9D5R3_9STRA|nr:hypothetical protein NSK_001990 [Nannochloropsis salina CCMP1776]|eukprot:TFJ86902.1 hypothetical protein NSK_001990 [Nannochloropsis salina CCMP1776]